MSRAFDSLPGAVGSPPQHYGNPFGEQRALADGEAIVDLSNRAVLTITGEDRLTWLDSLTSQSIAKLQPGQSAETLLLDPTGRLEHDIRLVDDGVSTWLLVDASEAESLQAWLSRMVFMLRVEVADVTDDYATIGTLGEPSFTAASPNGVPLVWNDPWREVQRGGHQYSVEAEHPAASWTYSEHLVDRAMVDGESPVPQLVAAVPAANDGPPPIKIAGTDALEALRIAAWRPRLATEADERTIPHELDWLRSAVHLTKGCYRGQETIAKVHNLGHPPRRLVMLHLDGSDGILPAHGDAVLSGDTEVGQVTSAARHYELGPIALAVVKRTTDPEAPLTVHTADGDIAAAQQVIVPPSAGAEADVPRLPRLRASAPQASN